MTEIVHEVWLELNEEGKELHTCIIAGALGEDTRKILKAEGAKFICSFIANSHVDAMIKYHEKVHNEVYSTTASEPSDFKPYPLEWKEQQQREGINLKQG